MEINGSTNNQEVFNFDDLGEFGELVHIWLNKAKFTVKFVFENMKICHLSVITRPHSFRV